MEREIKMTKKKYSKEQVNRIIEKIKKGQVAREEGYRKPLRKEKERTEKVFSKVTKAVQTKKNTSKQLQKRISKIEGERRELPKKRIEAMEKDQIFPSYSYTLQAKKLEDEKKRKEKKRKEKKITGLKSAQKNLREQYKKERKQKIKTGLLIGGSRVEARTERTLEKLGSALRKSAKIRMKHKKVFKKSKVDVTIKEHNPYSVLGERNQFFINEMEETKRSMFL